MNKMCRRKNRAGVPMPRVPAPVDGLRFHREMFPARGSTVTDWTAYLDGVEIGTWNAHGASWVDDGEQRHRLYLRDWRSAVRDEAARRVGRQMAPGLARTAGVDEDTAGKVATDIARALLG